MSEENTQAVVNEPAPAPEAAGMEQDARNTDGPGVADFLAEFETATASPPPTPAPKAPATDDISFIKEQLNSLLAERSAARENDDLKNAVIEAGDGIDLPAYAVEGYLHQLARNNPQVRHIWDNRQNNPAAAKRMLKSVNADLRKELAKRVDPVATADKEAVAAAVRGASPKAPVESAPNYSSMTDSELNAELAKHGL